jgi:hypothetical protein
MKVILLLLICGAVTLAIAQKKPRERERQQNQTASAEQNKQVARRVFDDLFTAGRYSQLDEIYDKNCIVHFGDRTERLNQAVDEGKGWRRIAPFGCNRL